VTTVLGAAAAMLSLADVLTLNTKASLNPPLQLPSVPQLG
jgi:hypothetical protein